MKGIDHYGSTLYHFSKDLKKSVICIWNYTNDHGWAEIRVSVMTDYCS